MLSLAKFNPSAGRIFVRPPKICGLAEFKPKMFLSRPEIYSKPAWGSILKQVWDITELYRPLRDAANRN